MADPGSTVDETGAYQIYATLVPSSETRSSSCGTLNVSGTGIQSNRDYWRTIVDVSDTRRESESCVPEADASGAVIGRDHLAIRATGDS